MRFWIAASALALIASCSPPAPPAAEAPAAPVAEAPAPAATPVLADPWAGATKPGAKVAAGYLTITNPGAVEDKLLGAASPRAARVEIHEMKMDGAVMSMAKVEDGLAIAPGGSVSLAPGGLHLMFLDISAPFAVGETVPVTLTFEKAGAVEASFAVRERKAGEMSGH